MARLAADIHLFPAVLAGPESGSSVETLAENTGTDPLLLRTRTTFPVSSYMLKPNRTGHEIPCIGLDGARSVRGPLRTVQHHQNAQ